MDLFQPFIWMTPIPYIAIQCLLNCQNVYQQENTSKQHYWGIYSILLSDGLYFFSSELKHLATSHTYDPKWGKWLKKLFGIKLPPLP